LPVYKLLAEKYSSDEFDIIIDAYGSQSLFDNCTSFLKENGPYVTVGIAFEEYTYGSMLVALSRMVKNLLWPRFLGGTPRKYIQVASVTTLSGLEKLRELCENGKLKVPVDSIWDFDDVPKVGVQRPVILL
jgi:reticulon-4-interacting protein 1, mitochondrial